jgi:NAD-dependent SIR2 family protein deacetylase
LTVGSSLVVYPAADFPELARRDGARRIIFSPNRQVVKECL